MSLQDVQRILRAPGRFVESPTNLAVGFPYGGSALGYHREAFLVPRLVYFDVWAQEWGRKVVKAKVREEFRLAAILRGYDPDAVGLFLAATPKPSGELYASADVRMGTLVADVKLLFAPLDLTTPGVLFQRAMPEVEAAARISQQLDDDAELAVLYDCGATASNGTPPWQIGLIEELTL